MTATTQVAYEDDLDYEIVNGHKEVKMAGASHGRIGGKVLSKIEVYLEQNAVGGVYLSNTTFLIGKNERMPDVSFVSAARFPPEGEPATKWEIAPDLAVEIISPNDIWDRVNQKVEEYFAAGVQQVWLVSLPLERVIIYDSPTQTVTLTTNDELTSERLLPGFKCRVADLFAR
ncbi:MAG: Uma2 family endonuclease [Acidobacteria bacterium]|nr:Uma2 family endonuclease [Acidobacteriota bacterium]